MISNFRGWMGDSEAYMIDTASGAVTKIRVGVEPDGLAAARQILAGPYRQHAVSADGSIK